MEAAKTLIRHVMRGFFDIRSILVMDALLIHVVLTDEEMSQMLGIQRKDLRGLCAKLKEDHLLAEHLQKVEGPGSRPLSKTYYYIHYREAIDAVKYKIHSIELRLKEQMGVEAQGQGYICDVCKSRYSTIDVISGFSTEVGGFVCDNCGSILREDDSSKVSASNQEKLGRYMNQINPVIEVLKHIEDSFIPENDFKSSLAIALPAPINSGIPGLLPGSQRGTPFSASSQSTPSSEMLSGIPTASHGAGNLSTSLQVNITSDKESAEIEQRQREERARLAKENALPTWHMESAVSQDSQENGNWDQDEEKQVIKETNSTEKTDEDKANEEALKAYYEQLAKQNAEEDEEDDEDDDDDDEEEGDFEDVE